VTSQARPGDPPIAPERVRQPGLTPDDFSRIRTARGRAAVSAAACGVEAGRARETAVGGRLDRAGGTRLARRG
jgi:hypothetical protein